MLVLIAGSEIKGAKAWFNVGGFSFQPAEIAKFGTALALSSYLSYFKTDLKQGVQNTLASRNAAGQAADDADATD